MSSAFICSASADAKDDTVGNCMADAGPRAGFSSKYIKSKGLGLDGCLQMSFQLAHYRLFGKTVSTYESANQSAYKHGRTETIRSATVESDTMCKVFSAPRRAPDPMPATLNTPSWVASLCVEMEKRKPDSGPCGVRWQVFFDKNSTRQQKEEALRTAVANHGYRPAHPDRIQKQQHAGPDPSSVRVFGTDMVPVVVLCPVCDVRD